MILMTEVLSAGEATAQFRKKVNIRLEGDNALTAIQQLEKQDVQFAYNAEQLKLDQIRIADRMLEKTTVEEVLAYLLDHTDVMYEETNGFIILKRKQQPGRLVGHITDERGEPLAGASIRIVELNRSFSTDGDGYFTISLQPGIYTVEVNYISYQRQTKQGVNVGGNGTVTVDFTLRESLDALDEVVVVGYGTQRKSDITGAVASVPKDRLEMVPNLNIGQALQGTVPGVVFMQSVGGAAPSGDIMIRGRNSILASNAPLIILDGVPFNGQLMDINVNDVASIEVLKDASSAAIYGSRGANGVILVTTKKGASGQAVIAYDGKYAAQKPNMMPRYMSAEEFYQFKEIREPGKVTGSEQALYDAGAWTDWAELAIRDGSSNQHNLAVSGTINDTKYYLSGGYLKVNGQTINNSFERISSRVNVETKVAKWFTIGTNTQLTFDDGGNAPVSWSDLFATNPLTSAYDENGDLTIYPWPEFIDIANPLAPLNYEYFDKSFQVVANNFLQVDIPFVQGLSYRLNNGLRKRVDDSGVYRGRNTSEGLANRGSANTSRGIGDNILLENILTYQKDIGKHHIFATALYSYEENKGTVNGMEANGFPHDFLGWYAVGQADFVLPSYGYNKTVLISQMLRLNYAYDNRYLLTLTGRRDGYSGFGADNKWGLFPSVALGWNIHRESFFDQDAWVNELKLRASYGTNGNQAVAAYESISRLGEENSVTGGTSLPGYIPTKIGQGNLGWETSRTLNIGMDYGLWKGRVSGDVNLYNTHTFDLLLNRTISPVHGITSITQNIGKTDNRGVEFSVNATLIEKNDFGWMASGNVALNRNKIVSLYGELDAQGNEIDDVANAWFIGRPILVNYDFKFAGVWQLGEEAEAEQWEAQPGYAKIVDVDGSKSRTEADRMVIGQLDPKTTWGLTNTWTYKDIGLSVFMHGVHGITKQNALLQDASASSEVRRNVIKKNWWTPDNPTNEFYMNAVNVQAAPIYENASFIRIKDITLFYNFPERLSKTLGLNRLRVYAVGRNLFTFTEWSASDPELNFGRGNAPLAKEFVFGLNIDF
ncbi:SusC/RagA family TonB-linked outer membrane protein [Parapedobacter koreensis]|nr:SusC/RagA family TonB-linked outer membrane protein [Parapedobacter koreensis]